MDVYTKRGGFNKMMNKFTKKKIVAMYIEDLKNLKQLKSSIEESNHSSSNNSNDENESSDLENDDAINFGEFGMERDNSFVSVNIFDSDPDVLVVSPTQVINKTFVENEVIRLTNSEDDVLVVSPTQVIKKSFLENEDIISANSVPDLSVASSSQVKKTNFFDEKNDNVSIPKNCNNQFINDDTQFKNDDPLDFGGNQFINPGNNFPSSTHSSQIDDLFQKIEELENNNKILFNKMYDVEVKSNSNDQYSRRNNFEIAGIPDNITQDKLEVTVSKILDKLNIKVGWNDFQACHRLKNHSWSNGPAKTIVRFVNRKHTILALSKKKTAKDIDISDIVGVSNNIYIGENLCPAYRQIYDAAYKLLKRGIIKHLWSYKGIVHIRVYNDSKYTTFQHMEDFKNFFY